MGPQKILLQIICAYLFSFILKFVLGTIWNYDGRIAFLMDKILNPKRKTIRLNSNDRSILGHGNETSTPSHFLAFDEGLSAL